MTAVQPSSQYRPFAITVVSDRRSATVVPAGELDLGSTGELEREVLELRRMGFDTVVVDLRELRFMDSAGLRLMLSLRNDAKRNGHALTLVPGPRSVQRVFELTATRSLFDWRD